ncbi:MAG: nuclear transport factor 2 family protein [Sedimentibacter sp.]
MHILEKYIAAIAANDTDKVAECFCEDGLFDDTAPVPLGGERAYVQGRENIRAAFKINFNGESGTVVPKMLSLHGNTMDYDAIAGLSGEIYIPCTGTAILEDGLIKEYYVRPRKK